MIINIFCDLDGVVFNFIDTFINFINDKKYVEYDISVKKLNGWQTLVESGQLTKEIEELAHNDFIEAQKYQTLPFIEFSKERINYLLNSCYYDGKFKLYFITSRPIETFHQTYSRLDKEFNSSKFSLYFNSNKAYTINNLLEKEKHNSPNEKFVNIAIDDKSEYLDEIKKDVKNCFTVLFNHLHHLKYSKEVFTKYDFYFENWINLANMLDNMVKFYNWSN